MAIRQATWTHGHSMAVEFPDRLQSTWRAGFFIRVVEKPNTTNWFHFGVPTKVIVNDRRQMLDSVMLRFRALSTQAAVTNVHTFDGENRIAAHDGLNLPPSPWNMHRFGVPGRPEVLWGVGITIGVAFTGTTDTANTMEFSAAGCDFFP